MQKAQQDKRPLQKMFHEVPPSYDFLNRLLTLRFDEVWRRKTAAVCLENNPERLLDLCCGTGDLTVHLGKGAPSGTGITALDYSPPMLELASEKALKAGLKGVQFIHGDAAEMPFANDHFDSIGIAFAFRNLTFRNPDSEKFLSEILRVLKPGGSLVIVETSQPKNSVFRKMFHLYLRWLTAPLGGILSGHYGAYKYLAHSARHYYNSRELEELILNSGFASVSSKLLLGGIAGIFTGIK